MSFRNFIGRPDCFVPNGFNFRPALPVDDGLLRLRFRTGRRAPDATVCGNHCMRSVWWPRCAVAKVSGRFSRAVMRMAKPHVRKPLHASRLVARHSQNHCVRSVWRSVKKRALGNKCVCSVWRPNSSQSVHLPMFREFAREGPTWRKRKSQRDGGYSNICRTSGPTKWTRCAETLTCAAFREIGAKTQKPLRT